MCTDYITHNVPVPIRSPTTRVERNAKAQKGIDEEIVQVCGVDWRRPSVLLQPVIADVRVGATG